MEQQALIGNNTAIKTLMNDEMMIGRHRPIVGKWFQQWVDEIIESEIMPEEAAYGQELEKQIDDLRERIALKVLSLIDISTEKVPILEDGKWRKGTPWPAGAKKGVEITAKFYAFRGLSREQEEKNRAATARG